jgi:hypothetical protein
MTDSLLVGTISTLSVLLLLAVPAAVGWFVRPVGTWLDVPILGAILALVPPLALFVFASAACAPTCSDADLGFGIGMIALFPIAFVLLIPGLVVGRLLRMKVRPLRR